MTKYLPHQWTEREWRTADTSNKTNPQSRACSSHFTSHGGGKLLAYYLDEVPGIGIIQLVLPATVELCRDSQYMTNKLYTHLHSLHLNASHYNPAESEIRTSLFLPLETGVRMFAR